jgi:glycosyltransferase involved in cell wall biosynthesis
LRISILVPAFNEQASIEKVLQKLVQLELDNPEIIVVNDGSTDQTGVLAHQFAQKYPQVRVFDLPKNQGKTAAIAKAVQESCGQILVIQDADLEYDPEELSGVIDPVRQGVADVVYGSRFMVKKASRVLYYYHYLANKFLTCLSNVLTNRNMSDIETCYKAFRREVIAPLKLTSSGFGLEVEITAMVCKTNARTYEVPISYYGRTYDEGKKIGLWDGVSAIWYILYYNLVHPWTSTGRTYIRTVNESLKGQ